jgi:hypothetical protein
LTDEKEKPKCDVSFSKPGNSSVRYRESKTSIASIGDIIVALLTNYERFPSSSSHLMYPLQFVYLSELVQVFEFAEVMDFNLVR